MRYAPLNQESVSSMRNALQLLMLFKLDKEELSLTEIADQLNVGLSTAYRLSYTLIEEGYLVKDHTSKNYRLSSSILSMGNTILSQIGLVKLSEAVLQNLVDKTGETAHISIIKQNYVVYINKVDSPYPVRLLSHVGKQNPIHCTSSGQLLLAYQPDNKIEEIISMGLPAYTKNTITCSVAFKKMLEAIRDQGYAICEEELHDGVTSIAAPIRNRNGQPVASINIAGPTTRVNNLNMNKLVKQVKHAAEELSH